jgi:hypothetical protein
MGTVGVHRPKIKLVIYSHLFSFDQLPLPYIPLSRLVILVRRNDGIDRKDGKA